MAETELERAEKRFAQARARLMALKNREATRSRKMDTRRKVILGGALVDLAGGNTAAAPLLDRLLRNLPRDQDRAAFDGWSPDREATEVGSGEAGDAGQARGEPSAPGATTSASGVSDDRSVPVDGERA